MGQNINIFFIVVLVILAAFMIWGYWRGFIRVAFSLVALIVMMVLVSWLSPYTNRFLQEHTSLQAQITEKCVVMIQEMTQENLQSNAQGLLDEAGTREGIQLPSQWSEFLVQKTAGVMDEVLEDTGIYQQAGVYLADLILRGISFLLTFILIAIALKIVIHLLDLIARLPVIKGVNRLFGAVAGLVEGLLVVWLLLFIVTLACTSQWGQQAMNSIHQSQLLTFLYQHNGIVYIVNRIFG